MTPRTSFRPAHWPTADMRNRSFDRRRTVLRAGVALAVLGMLAGVIWCLTKI